jgi:K+-sensing histidine kinase KdpD
VIFLHSTAYGDEGNGLAERGHQMREVSWAASMRLWTRIAPIVVPLLIIVAVTELLYFFKEVAQARHLVFFYLLPTAFVAMLYGSVLSMICAIDATLIADLFLYNPDSALNGYDPRAAGELFLFALTGLIGAKCMAELMRPSDKPHDGLEPVMVGSVPRTSTAETEQCPLTKRSSFSNLAVARRAFARLRNSVVLETRTLLSRSQSWATKAQAAAKSEKHELQ